MFETLIRPCVRYLVVALAFVAPALAAPASAQESTTLDVPGLQQPVEILVDRDGSVLDARNSYGFSKKWARKLEAEVAELLQSP